ncbi:glycoside hydrolase [candidate division MSBL1 archaeon SCGC-AAA259E17]|uniref:beta-fructofuranosidase n=1 Tax=candidate division MSBL1 archaeon SCGC-AAA259E17 TaxID=1698263 RepID=A0A133UCP2_9EURY|nr:glycoside hydrolase [candidate division MSBL1 archaeon SCGC-AAA259E17]
MTQFFFKPEEGWAGDFTPYYAEDSFKLFYLKDHRNGGREGFGKDWNLVTTEDFVDFNDLGPTGIYGGTGSVIQVEDTYHIFYCRAISPKEQIISHAISDDLENWEKKPEDDFPSDGEIYEKADWRDPHVFWNEEEEEYWMLVCGRTKEGESDRKGCVGLCTSQDLKNWEIKKPFYAPNMSVKALECPDIFKMGDWWYLVFSTTTDKFGTFYRMSKSMTGPWKSPPIDTFDGRAFYAGKTCKGAPGSKIYTEGEKRYIFGWNPTKEGEYGWNPGINNGLDYDSWDWGGSLIVHRLIQKEDGTLRVKVPKTIKDAFKKEIPLRFSRTSGKWDIDDNRLRGESPLYFSQAIAQELPEQCRISGIVSYEDGTRGFGISLRTQEDLANGYYVELEPNRNRIVYKSYIMQDPRMVPAYEVEIERPVDLIPEKDYGFEVLIDDSVCEFYLGDEVAMSMRMYDLEDGRVGLFVREGEASFKDIKLSVHRD